MHDRTTRPAPYCLAAGRTDQPRRESKHGNVRAIFKAGERASRNPSASLARLIEALRPFRPGDFISWLGGDTLVAMLAGVALSTLGVSEWKWLRFIGNDEYQVIHVSLDDLVQSDAEVL
jgi:hypothetical protein